MTSENTYTSINNFINTISASNINRVLTFGLKHFPNYFYVYYEYVDKQSGKMKGKIEAQFEFTADTIYEDIINNLISEQQLTQEEKQKINRYLETGNNDIKQRGFLKIILNHLNEINNIVCTNKTFYNDNNCEIFKEIFIYRDKQYLMENERRVSYILDIDNRAMGFGFYKNYNVFGNLLIAVNNDKEVNVINYGITQDQLASISEDINRKSYFGGFGISIKAKAGGSYDCLYELNEKCRADQNNKFCILPIVPSYDKLNTIIPKNITNYNYLKENFGFSEERYNNKKFALLPIRCNKHASVIIIDLEHIDTFYSFDSSLAHRDPRDRSKLDEHIFGNYLANHTKSLIDKPKLQFNGTCTYWSDAFCEVVVTSPEYNGDNGLENIKRDCANGTMFLKCAQRIGRIFDEQLDKPTIKIYEDQNVNNNNYYNFNINGRNYGISKTSGLNKFVNLETLIETLGVEPTKKGELRTSLKHQIEGQKRIREKEREIVNFEQLEIAKEKYDEYIEEKIESINSQINNTLCIRFFKRRQLRNDKINLETERNNFNGKFIECKEIYDSIDDRKDKYTRLKQLVENNEDLNTSEICDYINSSDLNNNLEILMGRIQTFEVMKDNKYNFDFCSEADEVMGMRETRTTDGIEQLLEIREIQETPEVKLNGTTSEKTTETKPNIPNTQTTNPFSSMTATNVGNPINYKPPTSPNNPNNSNTERMLP